MSKSQASSPWWPEHCKDESEMHLHRQQADVYHTLKGMGVFVDLYRNITILLIGFSHLPLAVTMNVLHSLRHLFDGRAALWNGAGSDRG